MGRVLRILESKEGVSPVIAVIMMVTITVMLSILLYAMLTQFINDGGTIKPFTAFTPVGIDDGTATVKIADIDRQFSLDTFGIILWNNSCDAPGLLEPLVDGGNASSCGAELIFNDLPGKGFGSLTAGDEFAIIGTNNTIKYELALLFRGGKIAAQNW